MRDGKRGLRTDGGFTLVEILVALAVFGILSTAIFSLFTKNVRTYTAQTLVVDAQQDLRAGMMIMSREIRMAGYSPVESDVAGIVGASGSAIQFTMDINGKDILDGDGNKIGEEPDGDVDDGDEDITYAYDAADDEVTRNGQPLVQNVEDNGLNFAYAIKDGNGHYLLNDGGFVVWAVPVGGIWFDLDVNKDGVIDASDDTADGSQNGTISGRSTGVSVDPGDIRAVQIWMLARVQAEDPDLFSLSQKFVVGNRVLEYKDRIRRRLLTSIVKCRNMGL